MSDDDGHSASSLLHPCDHCGKTSPSNLRCSKCHSVWYCDRSCQSSAWNPPSTTTNANNGMQGGNRGKHGGHREVCRQLCKAAKKKNKEKNAFVELIQHAQNLDCNEAYRRMCLAQDEIHRMKSSVLVGELTQHQGINDQQLQLQQHDANHNMDQTIQIENTRAVTNVNDGINSCAAMTTNKLDELQMQSSLNPNKEIRLVPNVTSSPTTIQSPQPPKVSGIWLEHGGKISIEFLPNVKCYRVVLLLSPPPTSSDGVGVEDSWNDFPKSRNELHYTIKPQIVTIEDGMHNHFEVKLYQCRHDAILSSSSSSSSSSLTLDREEGQTLLLSMSLPTPAWHVGHAKEGEGGAMLPNMNISLDDSSISLRIQLMQNESHATPVMATSESEHLVDKLLGVVATSSPSFSPHVGVTTPLDLNYLRCRSCQNRLLLLRDTSSPTTLASVTAVNNDAITNQNDTPHPRNAIIQAVLPLPSGFWDDISDYLMCYDGQASVDFTSASTSAIARMALQDDAILVLHKSDLDGMGGICVLDTLGGGYGESATMAKGYYGKHDKGSGDSGGDGGGGGGASFRAWRDKAAIQGMKSKTATCANCYSTLGYVSEHDNDTFRFYKHLLDCGKEIGDDDGNECEGTLLERGGAIFAKHTCASFLARELVRYAESDAIYTFIVTISDVNDWTRMGRNSPGACILLRTLGWDTPMSTVTGGKRLDGPAEGGGSGDLMNYPLSFQKVVKVIFEVATDRDILTPFETGNGDNLMEWTWGGIDLCCPPPRMASSPNADSLIEDELAVQTRASSVGISLSEREWCELKHALHRSSDYFTDSVSDALVMTKLGVLPKITNDRKQTARLSFLPLVTY